MNRLERLALGLVIALGVGIQLPGLGRPYGWIEQNPGLYYGVFVRNYEGLGFLETRGVPLWRYVGESVEALVPNFSHPPGVPWLFFLAGGSEASCRSVTLLAMVLGALALFALLRGRLGPTVAIAGAATHLLAPALGFVAMASGESLAVACGLGLILGVQRIGEGRRGALTWLLLAVSCSLGPWTDWPFAFFCAGAAVLGWHRSPREIVRRLWPGAAMCIVSFGLFLVWREWAWRLPGLVTEGQARGIVELLQIKVIDRPPWGELLPSILVRLRTTFTTPLVVVIALGTLLGLARATRVTLALLVAGFTAMLLFGFQADPVYCSYVAPMAGLACGLVVERLAAVLPRPRMWRITLTVLLAGYCAFSTRRMIDADSTTFLRDAGRILTAASRDNEGRPAYFVTYDLFAYYGTYVESPDVFPFQVADPKWLQTAIDLGGEKGVRHLWLRIPGVERPVDAFLAPFPKERRPELEGFVRTPEGSFEVSEAWVVTLRDPPR